MLKFIDGILNRVTMYRLTLYFLLWLIGAATILGALGFLPYAPGDILFSATLITLCCLAANWIFARVFEAPTNSESVYITALILSLIIAPLKFPLNSAYLGFVIWAAIWAMASKYILTINKKHIFNPAAFAVALTALTINQSANWWVGTAVMLPAVLAAGLLLVRKIQRADLVWSFVLVATGANLAYALARGSGIFPAVYQILVSSPILFFAFVMLTEPLTTPPTRVRRVGYGALVGWLFARFVHVGPIYSTPELALLAGNVFSYLISPKQKLFLKLKEKVRVAFNTYDFVFAPANNFNFRPGQYLEWTLPHLGSDSRGNRRYFTIASSPTENDLRLGVKFYPKASSFKSAMLSMPQDGKIVAGQLAGDFVLPRDPKQKLVFMAGGIGITPFRSMVKYLLDRREARSLVLFYANRTANDIAYKEVFDQAGAELGMKTVYTLSDQSKVPSGWTGRVGYINERVIAEDVPDFRERLFYLSGPRSMVESFESSLRKLGVASSRIKTDFFPGFV